MGCVALTGALAASADVATAAPEPPSQQGDARPAPIEPTGRRASMAAMQSGRLGCGTVITRSTTLTADIGPCAGNGVIVGADGIMLDLNGHTISGFAGPGSGNDAGIRLPNRTGVRITGQPGSSGRRGTVTGFDAGVVVNGGSGNTVENLNVRDNVGPDELGGFSGEIPVAELGDGIILFKSASNRILNNVVTNNGIYDGIGVFGLGSTSNLVAGNIVQDTVGLLGNFSASGTGILINHFLDQRPGTGLVISANGAESNIVRRNFGSGISSIGNVDGRIVGNIVEDNGAEYRQYALEVNIAMDYPANGIGVQAGSGQRDPGLRMVVSGNVSDRNGLNGVYVSGNASSVTDNSAFENGAIGILVRRGVDGNRITYNRTGYNGILDLYDEGGYDNARDGIDSCPNIWFANTWGPVQPGAQEVPWMGSFVTAYAPNCTAAGGSGG